MWGVSTDSTAQHKAAGTPTPAVRAVTRGRPWGDGLGRASVLGKAPLDRSLAIAAVVTTGAPPTNIASLLARHRPCRYDMPRAHVGPCGIAAPDMSFPSPGETSQGGWGWGWGLGVGGGEDKGSL